MLLSDGTRKLGDFKPREHNLLGAPIVETVFEPKVGESVAVLLDNGLDRAKVNDTLLLSNVATKVQGVSIDSSFYFGLSGRTFSQGNFNYDAAMIKELPLQRTYAGLFQLIPGVAENNAGTAGLVSGGRRLAGGRLRLRRGPRPRRRSCCCS